ncbi:CHAT domain-containing protein [Aulosira sp. FACHB-615]|uniref:CHAT domain-containing protein n=1 Tax=Aulosira sp. FACHB-615 TaxID=2692777 RepID=UPI0016874B4E|nr:CHAT domain-containing protein [Aulosira sp. FACHB-615]MBD2492517.1 CHAT domain-containing protein [Aulosira sp. FACHB-615]
MGKFKKRHQRRWFWQSFRKTLILAVFVCVLSIAVPSIVAQIFPSRAIAQSPQNPLDLIKQANRLYQSGNFTAAVQIWQQAAIAFASQKNYLNQAMALSNLSLTYQQLGKWNEAKTAIIQSLQLLKTLETTTAQQRIYAQTLDIQGQLEQKIGQSQAALETWQESAKIYVVLSDQPSAAISEINQAQALQDLGLYPRACQTLLQALGFNVQRCELSTAQINSLKQKLLENKPDKLQEAQGRGLRSLGNVLRVVGKLEQSEEVLKASLEVAQKWKSPQDISKVWLNLGNTNRALAKREATFKDNKKANIYKQEALVAYQQVTIIEGGAQPIATSSLVKIQALLNQRDLFIEQQKWAAADELLSPIRESLANLSPSRTAIYAKINFARSLAQKPSNVSEAMTLLENAITQAKSLEDWRSLSYALGNLGKLYGKINQEDKAKIYTQQALQATKQIRSADDLAYQWQWQLGKLLRGEDKEDAIAAYANAVKSLKNLRGDLVSLNSDVQFDFREQVEPVYREYVDLLLQAREPSQETLKIARQTIEDLQLAELDNFFQEACTTVKNQEIDKVDVNTAVIYSVILSNRLEIILSLPIGTQSNLRYYTISVSQPEIEATVKELSEKLSVDRGNNREKRRLQELSKKVYSWLIAPLEKDLAALPIKNLTFVLDGVLQNIPMAALYDGKQYLIEKNYSISLTPGLQLLDPKPIKLDNLNLLAAGLSQSVQDFDPLPGVEEEFKGIRQQISAKILLNEMFTKSKFTQTINSLPFSTIHVATHGEFSSRSENTFILAYDDKIKAKELDEFFRTDTGLRPIELLVLSACNTAKGDTRAALGLAGVAIRAGARSTVASLWLASDDSTPLFMIRFYEELRNRATKAEALRQAQLAILRDEQFSHPYYWAAFVLIGNWL